MSSIAAFRFPAERRKRAAQISALLLIAAAVYLNSLLNGFALDDVLIVQDNSRVHDLGALKDIWLTPYWPSYGVELGLWRPLTIFLFAVQWAIGDGGPLAFHVVNVLLHALNTLLVFVLVERVTSRRAALVGALIFAVHPVHTEAVANVVGQSELLVAAFLLGACLVHSGRPPGLTVSWSRRAVLAALFLGGLLTKEHAVVLPGLLLSLDLAQRRIPLDRTGMLRYARAVSPVLLLLLIALTLYLVVRFHVLQGALLGIEAGPQLHFLREEYRVLNGLRAFPEVLSLLIFPYQLAADYSPAMILPVESWTFMTAVGAVLLGATVLLALATPWKPAAGLPAAWFMISFVTVSNLLFPVGVLIAERTLYLPSVALSLAVAYGWLAGAPKVSPSMRHVAAAALLLVLILGGVRTWIRNPDWKSTRTIQYALMRDHPESYKAQWTFAIWQYRQGNPEVARPHFQLALDLYPRDSQLMSEYGAFLLEQGEIDRAVELLEAAHEIHPSSSAFAVRLANGYLAAGRYADAMRIATALDRIHRPLADEIRSAARAGASDSAAYAGARDSAAHAGARDTGSTPP
ncbi:tetratricopeptide repeat protein [soil metagenome]